MTRIWTGCFGKLPIFGDFLRYNAFSATVKSMDTWFQEGLIGFRDQHGDGWGELFQAIRPRRFLVSPGQDGRVAGGVLVPGIDKAGRRFPFVIYTELADPIPAGQFSGLPIILDAILGAAEDLAVSGWQDLAPRQLYDRVEALASAGDLDHEVSLVQALAGTKLQELWPGTLASAGEDGRLVLLQNLVDLLRPSRAAKFVLAMPGAGSAVECAFWLELAFALNGGKPLASMVMWDAPGAGGPASGTLTMVFDQWRAAYFQPMLRPDLPSKKMCRMVQDGLQSADRIERSRAAFGELLEDGALPLHEFVQEFVRLVQASRRGG